jgi:hypothetical protein
MQIRLAAPAAGIRADRQARTISGPVVPWDVYAAVSTGQTVAFARGSIILGERSKLVLDHDPAQPVAVFVAATDTGEWLEATFRVPPGPAGDQVLADAQEGLRDGFSVGVDVLTAEDRPEGTYVTAARGRHVALLSEPAFDAARVASVTAAAPDPAPPDPTAPPAPTGDSAVTDTAPTPLAITFAGPLAVTTIATDDLPGGGGDDEITPTAAAMAPAPVMAGAPARTQDAYPYYLGGPHSMIRDCWLSHEGDPEAGARLVKAQRFNADPRQIAAATVAMARAASRHAQVMAAPGDTGSMAPIIPPGYRPDFWTPLIAYESPIYNAASKSPISDFTPFTIPREVSRAGLSGTPADEVTPTPPGTITANLDTVTPQMVYGSYEFSRALAMSSNPAIDMIANNALDEEWLKDIETRAVAFWSAPANHTAAAVSYDDGASFIATMRSQMAAQRVTRKAATRNTVTGTKEYMAAVAADDASDRPLLGWDGATNMYGPGTQSNAAADATILGVPTLPEGAAPLQANTSFLFTEGDAVCFATPVMNFRIEYNGNNPLVITLVKYSGVAFWTRQVLGVRMVTNGTPLPLDDPNGGDTASSSPGRSTSAGKR